jgi:hypothetical protein
MGVKKTDRILMAVTIDGLNYAYYARKIVYADLGGITGVAEGKTSTDYEADFNLRSFMKSGRVRYIKVSNTDGKTFRVLCVGDNVKTALANLKKKKIDGKPINTAWIPSHQYLR